MKTLCLFFALISSTSFAGTKEVVTFLADRFADVCKEKPYNCQTILAEAKKPTAVFLDCSENEPNLCHGNLKSLNDLDGVTSYVEINILKRKDYDKACSKDENGSIYEIELLVGTSDSPQDYIESNISSALTFACTNVIPPIMLNATILHKDKPYSFKVSLLSGKIAPFDGSIKSVGLSR